METIRRSEYRGDAAETIDVLDHAKYGHLATTDEAGRPVCKPMNFARADGRIYFHRARPGEMSAQLERPVCFTAEDALAWLPSSWRHAELACPATTYYRSVVVKGMPVAIEDPLEKAAALEAFMQKYQPEGGYRAIRAGDPLYKGPIQGVLVFALDLAGATCKLKVGQNLDAASKKRVMAELLARGGPGDARTARAMARSDPALAAATPLYPRREGAVTFVDEAADIPLDQLTALLGRTYWAAGRPRDVMARALAGSYLALAALDGAGRLIAFARVVSDGALHAWVHDVVVDGSRRGMGLGRRLMEHLIAHPRLSRIATIALTTVDRMAFYESFGFKRIAAYDATYGRATMMKLVRSILDQPVAGRDERVEQRAGAEQLVGGEGAAGSVGGDGSPGGQHRGERGHPLPVGVGDQGGAPACARRAPELGLHGAPGAAEAGGEPAGEREQAGHPRGAPAGEARHP